MTDDALRHLFDRLKAGGYPAAELGGIYANKPGYHNRRDNLPPSDYSCQLPDDLAGSGANAAALDVTLRDPDDMQRLTARLVKLADTNHPAIAILREFFGTLDGVTVTGRDIPTGRHVTSDDSHLWHVHISCLRRWAGSFDDLDWLADAILEVAPEPDNPTTGYPWPGPQTGDPEMLFVRVVDENGAIYAIGPGYKHHCSSEEWSSANAAGFDCPNVNARQRDVLYSMVNSQTVKTK